jgi:hypothetical protein
MSKHAASGSEMDGIGTRQRESIHEFGGLQEVCALNIDHVETRHYLCKI